MVVFPRRMPSVVVGLIGLVLVVSLVAAIDARNDGTLYDWLALVPSRVWSGELWRLATWTLVERDPWALIFACATIYWFGGDLLEAWGRARTARFVVGIVVIAAAGTSIVALALRTAGSYLGGFALGDALVIAWALQFPYRTIRLYGDFRIGGASLAYGTFGLTLLFAVFYGVTPFLPEVVAGAAALLYMGDAGGALQRWTSELQTRYRRRHLRVVR